MITRKIVLFDRLHHLYGRTYRVGKGDTTINVDGTPNIDFIRQHLYIYHNIKDLSHSTIVFRTNHIVINAIGITIKIRLVAKDRLEIVSIERLIDGIGKWFSRQKEPIYVHPDNARKMIVDLL